MKMLNKMESVMLIAYLNPKTKTYHELGTICYIVPRHVDIKKKKIKIRITEVHSLEKLCLLFMNETHSMTLCFRAGFYSLSDDFSHPDSTKH